MEYITEFLSIGIIGVGVSLLVQFIKTSFGTNGIKTKLLTVFLSIVVGGIIYWLKDTSYWQSVIEVLVGASTIYAFFIKK